MRAFKFILLVVVHLAFVAHPAWAVYDPNTGQFLSREPLGEKESLNLYSYCHNDPVNKVDVLGMAEVVTSTPEGNGVLVNDETSFWLIYNMMANAGLVGKLDPWQPGAMPTFADAMLVAGKLGGKAKTYSKYFPWNASGENSPNDLWIMPFTVPQLPGSPGGHFDAFLIKSQATHLAQGKGFYLDAIDVRAIQAAGEATSAYPWGSLSKHETWALSDRGAVLRWMDTPLATLGDGSGEYWGPEWGKWQPIGGRNGALYDYAMATNPFGTPRQVRNMFAVEVATAGLAKGLGAFRMLGSGKALRTFYTVQGRAGSVRLSLGGAPWPGSPTQAHLGPGLYAWGSRSQAEAYMSLLQSRGASGLSIVEASITQTQYNALRMIDLRMLGDDAANAWLLRYSSLYGDGLPHGLNHIIRGTGNFGPEYYFADEAFSLFKIK